MPSDAATSATERPEATNSRARRRNPGGYGFGTINSLQQEGSRTVKLLTGVSAGRRQHQGVCAQRPSSPLSRPTVYMSWS
jgi:hypothetical protein